MALATDLKEVYRATADEDAALTVSAIGVLRGWRGL